MELASTIIQAPGALADELAARHRITVVHRAGKLGLGTAVIEGFAAANAPIVGVIDADLSHPPALLPRMLAVMQSASADFVIGSRYIPGGGTRDWGLGRLLMSRASGRRHPTARRVRTTSDPPAMPADDREANN